jgi:hypothetical protein
MNRFVRAWVLLTILALAAAPAWGAIFSDIQGLPAQRAIERLTAKGIFPFPGVRGAPDKFNPAGPVTRADFASLLVQAIGLDTTGIALPKFRDAAEIPQNQQSAIAAITSLGSVSPQKVELKRGSLVYTLATDKTVYAPGDMILITFTIQNATNQDVQFEHANSQLYDFIIRSSEGQEVAKWSLGRAFIPVQQPVTLAAERKFEWKTQWKQIDQSDDPVDPGRYEIIAIHTTKATPTSISLFYNKGVMSALAENNFRPKQEVTRLELATVVARAIGLADARPASLNATDGEAIPAAARGTVAAALEKGIITLVGNREFRPNQKATRGELAQALDQVMITLNRYNFTKGTLKDPITGNPPQISIEDERRSLRVFRVARVHAVYRNDRPAELRDLRPGDALSFLNRGDVGDVAYIEATAR